MRSHREGRAKAACSVIGPNMVLGVRDCVGVHSLGKLAPQSRFLPGIKQVVAVT